MHHVTCFVPFPLATGKCWLLLSGKLLAFPRHTHRLRHHQARTGGSYVPKANQDRDKEGALQVVGLRCWGGGVDRVSAVRSAVRGPASRTTQAHGQGVRVAGASR